MSRRPLALLATVDPLLRDAVAMTAALEPGTVVVRHDLLEHGDDGQLRRVISDVNGVIEDVVVPLDHACVSCAIREDAIPTLRRLAESGPWTRAVLALPISADSEPVARTLAPHAQPGGELGAYRLASVVCAADLAAFEEDLFSTDLLADRGRQLTEDDRRAVGEVLAALVEHADVVVTSSSGSAVDGELLDHVRSADGVRVDGIHHVSAPVLFDREHDVRVAERRTDPFRTPTIVGRTASGVSTVHLVANRPFHPERLLDRIEDLGARRVRSRGVFWVANRPDSIIEWDGAGGQLSVGQIGLWGSRTPVVDLTFTGREADVAGLGRVFDDVLLTDEEVREGHAMWLDRHDVLEPWLGARSFG